MSTYLWTEHRHMSNYFKTQTHVIAIRGPLVEQLWEPLLCEEFPATQELSRLFFHLVAMIMENSNI